MAMVLVLSPRESFQLVKKRTIYGPKSPPLSPVPNHELMTAKMNTTPEPTAYNAIVMSVLKRGHSCNIMPTGKITMKGAMEHDSDEARDDQFNGNASFMDDLVAQFNVEPLLEYVNVDGDMKEEEITGGASGPEHPVPKYLKVELCNKW